MRRASVLGIKIDECPTCHAVAPHVLVRVSDWGVLLFLPLLLLWLRHQLLCTECGAITAIGFAQARRAMREGRMPLDRERTTYDAVAREMSGGAAAADWQAMGLTPGASKEEIHARYRKLAKTMHPDVGGDGRAFARMAASYRRLLAAGASAKTGAIPPVAEVFDPFIVNPNRGFWDLWLKAWPVIAVLAVLVAAVPQVVRNVGATSGPGSTPVADAVPRLGSSSPEVRDCVDVSGSGNDVQMVVVACTSADADNRIASIYSATVPGDECGLLDSIVETSYRNGKAWPYKTVYCLGSVPPRPTPTARPTPRPTPRPAATPRPTSAPRAVPTPPDGVLTADETWLMARIPASVRKGGDCAALGNEAGGPGWIATITCDLPEEDVTVWYTAFDSQESKAAAYRASVGDLYGSSKGCPGDGGEGTWSYGNEEKPGGRLACWIEDGMAFLIWSDNRTRTVNTAIRSGTSWGPFQRWWREAGPEVP